MIGIRADANAVVATGHIMRCITIAKQLIKQKEDVVFLIADEYPIPMLTEAGMPYICLNSNWENLEEELTKMKDLIHQKKLKKLLVDSYFADAAYLKELTKSCKVIYIDDNFEDIYPVDMIINYNGFCTQFPYEKSYSPNTRLLLGPQFVPLREQFDNQKNSFIDEKKEELQVLLSSGGGDYMEAMYGVLKKACEDTKFQNLTFHVILGSFCESKEKLKAFVEEQEKNPTTPKIILHESVSDMAKLMAECDLAISAAGTMLYELCAVQVPTIFFMAADNQKYDSDFFMKPGDNGVPPMLYAGDIRSDRDVCLTKICTLLKDLIHNTDIRNDMRDALGTITDGKGANRIADEIISL